MRAMPLERSGVLAGRAVQASAGLVVSSETGMMGRSVGMFHRGQFASRKYASVDVLDWPSRLNVALKGGAAAMLGSVEATAMTFLPEEPELA